MSTPQPLLPHPRRGPLGGAWRAGALALTLFSVAGTGLPVLAQESQVYEMSRLAARKKQFPADEAALELGAAVYRKRCAFCHGDQGRGDGGAAAFLAPRPRDFTLGLFKFRSTLTGELPTDEDLFRSISRGVTGTAMPAWGERPFVLPEAQRWAVTYHVKQISTEDFKNPDFNPYDYLIPMPDAPQCTPQMEEEGKALYADESKGGCIKCHGLEGRGDGAEAGTQIDDWGDPMYPADLSQPWSLRNGTSRRELFRSLSTGFNGTPMAGFGETLNEGQRWAAVCYLQSLMDHPSSLGEVVLSARRAANEIPTDPDAPFWNEQAPLSVALAGQLVTTPRLALPAIDMVTVRAAYDDDEIAFHFTWNDRFKNVNAPAEDRWQLELEEPGAFVTAREMRGRRGGDHRDRLEIQFPAKASDGPDKPFFFMGTGSAPVRLWTWSADWNEAPESHGGRVADERVAKGYRSAPRSLPEDEQRLAGRAEYLNGQWRLVLKRPRTTGDKAAESGFGTDRLIPFAIHAWEGGNGEEGPLCSISSWYYVVLVGEIDPMGYAWAALGSVLALGLTAGLVRWARAVPSDFLEPRPAMSGPASLRSGA